MTTATGTTSAAEKIERSHLEAAGRFIDVIVARDPLTTMLGEAYSTFEAERLWDRFTERYEEVVSGAYAKHGADALRLALAAL